MDLGGQSTWRELTWLWLRLFLKYPVAGAKEEFIKVWNLSSLLEYQEVK